jgi:Flp pilus assembly pilin Flp
MLYTYPEKENRPNSKLPRVSRLFSRFFKKTSGATSLEYSLIIAGIAVAMIVSVSSLGKSSYDSFKKLSDGMTGVTEAGSQTGDKGGGSGGASGSGSGSNDTGGSSNGSSSGSNDTGGSSSGAGPGGNDTGGSSNGSGSGSNDTGGSSSGAGPGGNDTGGSSNGSGSGSNDTGGSSSGAGPGGNDTGGSSNGSGSGGAEMESSSGDRGTGSDFASSSGGSKNGGSSEGGPKGGSGYAGGSNSSGSGNGSGSGSDNGSGSNSDDGSTGESVMHAATRSTGENQDYGISEGGFSGDTSSFGPDSSSRDIKENKTGNNNLNTKTQVIIFKVQILSSSTRLTKNSPQFKGLKNVWEYKENGLYKYTVGNETDLKSAYALQSELRKMGFVGAFVVAFKNGKRIPIREARKLLNQYCPNI